MSLLPANATLLERAFGAVAQPTADPRVIATLWNPATCPATHLPWLAWALSVDAWNDQWDEATQRRVIAASIEVHRKKGTVGAVRRALEVFCQQARLTEWWQLDPPGPVHTFTVTVELVDQGITEATLRGIEQQIVSVKPVRSHFTTRLIGRSNGAVALGCAVLSGEHTTVLPYNLTEIASTPSVPRIGIGWGDSLITTIYPAGAH